MIVPLIVFFACAVLAVTGAILLILAREPIHSALSLILVMVSLAILYLLLGAEFISAIQIIVYAGAVMVLFVFVIMLLNAGAEERTDFSKFAKYVGLAFGFFLLIEVVRWMYAFASATAHGPSTATAAVSTRDLSAALFRQYLFNFEATSILILIAILGALVLARRSS